MSTSRYHLKDLRPRGWAWTKATLPKAHHPRCRLCPFEGESWAELKKHWRRTHGRRPRVKVGPA